MTRFRVLVEHAAAQTFSEAACAFFRLDLTGEALTPCRGPGRLLGCPPVTVTVCLRRDSHDLPPPQQAGETLNEMRCAGRQPALVFIDPSAAGRRAGAAEPAEPCSRLRNLGANGSAPSSWAVVMGGGKDAVAAAGNQTAPNRCAHNQASRAWVRPGQRHRSWRQQHQHVVRETAASSTSSNRRLIGS
jgi:hypothetical protein